MLCNVMWYNRYILWVFFFMFIISIIWVDVMIIFMIYLFKFIFFVIIFVSFINSRVFVYVVGRIIDIGKVVSVFWIFCNKVYIGVR